MSGAGDSGHPVGRGAGDPVGGDTGHPVGRAVLLGVLSAGSGIGLLATSGWLITTASMRPPVLSLCVAIGAVQAFALARGVARYGERLAIHDLSLRRLGALRLALFETLEPLVPGGLGRTTTGSLLSAYVADTEAVVMAWARRLLAGIDVTAAGLLGVALVLAIDPRCAAVLACGATLAPAASLASSRLDRRAAGREAAVRADVAEAAMEAVGSAVELAAYGRCDLVSERLDELGRRSAAAARRRGAVAAGARAAVLLIAGATLVGVLAAGLAGHPGLAGHRLSGVDLAVVAFATLAVLEAGAQLPDALAVSRSGAAAAERLAELARLESPVAEPSRPATPPARPAGVALEGATVVAPDRAVLLDTLSCAVAAGRWVALVGPSGSGKTTALHALLRFCALRAGRATVGGADVGGLDRASLAERIGWVPEEPHVFAASLGDNLRIASPAAADERVVEALERAGLGDWWRALPEGLATMLGTGGQPLSAGERQRLVLARALLAAPDVLLVDEPTAHLDAETAAVVLDGLASAAQGTALLVVTHDPAVSELADEIVPVRSWGGGEPG